MKNINVLIIEDSFYSADLNVRELRKAGFVVQFQIVASKRAMQEALKDRQWDIILSDNNMPCFDALQAIVVRNESGSRVPFAIVSEDISDKGIKEAMEAGCCAYISKEHLSMLGQQIRNILGVGCI
ncbi:MAG: response regulator [Clostridia bacterium]